jgi:hypothetical protein
VLIFNVRPSKRGVSACGLITIDWREDGADVAAALATTPRLGAAESAIPEAKPYLRTCLRAIRCSRNALKTPSPSTVIVDLLFPISAMVRGTYAADK